MNMKNTLKIDIITGSYPPMRCGVGDYTYQLVKALRKEGIAAGVLTSTAARLRSTHSFLRPIVRKWTICRMILQSIKMHRLSHNIVHIQYPTIGYGYHLGPQILLILLRLKGIKIVSTIHEFHLARTLRRISLLPFLIWSNSLIFTAEEERGAVLDAYPWLKRKLQDKCYVIPVGSNIPVIDDHMVTKTGDRIVSFFGLFYPGRRIELVIDSFKKAYERHPDLKFRLIGDIHPRHKAYFHKIRSYAEDILPLDRIEWVLGKTPEEIAVALLQSDVCVLPFPDGASFRRTTLIAALSLGVPIVTSKGRHTPDKLIDAQNVLFAENEDEMAEKINSVLIDKELSAKLKNNEIILSRMFSWEQIAREHIRVYTDLISE